MKQHPLAGQSIEGRRLHHRIAISTGMWPAPVVGNAEENVGPGTSRGVGIIRKEKTRRRHDHQAGQPTGESVMQAIHQQSSLRVEISGQAPHDLPYQRIKVQVTGAI
jgi:hypothetical protein